MMASDLSKRIGQVTESLSEMTKAEDLLNAVVQATDVIVAAMKQGGKLLICGNGGSAADAQHMAGEFVCRFRKDRQPLSALALSTDTSVLTAISNDYSFGDVFSRQVLAYGKPGDVLLGISTSGNSENVRAAFEAAKRLGLKRVLLTGNTEKSIFPLSNITIKAPSTHTPLIQEMHLIIEHIICEAVEKEVCG